MSVGGGRTRLHGSLWCMDQGAQEGCMSACRFAPTPYLCCTPASWDLTAFAQEFHGRCLICSTHRLILLDDEGSVLPFRLPMPYRL
jgi:hypothetical protein